MIPERLLILLLQIGIDCRLLRNFFILKVSTGGIIGHLISLHSQVTIFNFKKQMLHHLSEGDWFIKLYS